MTGAEIIDVLKSLESANTSRGFYACPLSLVTGCDVNPDVHHAQVKTGWPFAVCQAIAKGFDSDAWPEAFSKMEAFYHRRFALAITAGITACREHDDRGSTW